MDFQKNARVIYNGNEIYVGVGTVISDISKGQHPCGGKGKCGKCKVVAKGNLSDLSETEKEFLSFKEISNGVRLACITKVLGNCTIEDINTKSHYQIIENGKENEHSLNPVFKNYGVAIDIGTTTIVGRLYDVNGKILASTSVINPQYIFGADVISRIEAALSGNKEKLKKLVINAVDSIILTLAENLSINVKLIDAAVITGNTVMLYLLTGELVEPLSCAPFEIKRKFGEKLTAEKLSLLSISEDTLVYIPPCISAFVGADIVCDLIAVSPKDNETVLLADIGTNGEIALWNKGELTVCSTAAGPAFEGVGISKGMCAQTGAIDKVTNNGETVFVHTIGEAEAVGICGSGIIDAAACMLNMSAIEESGYMQNEPFILTNEIGVTQNDIRKLQLAKSAVRSGIDTLLPNICDLDKLAIAGGFSSYMNISNAMKIGLLPQINTERVSVLGNTAIGGAAMILLNEKYFKTALELSQKAKVTDLALSETFKTRYMENMFF